MDAISDLGFFAVVAKAESLREAAQQLGVTPPAVSKRLVVIERRLGVRLMQRTTRRTSLTPEGELYLVEGAKVLEDLDILERKVAGARAVPRGILRVVATLGFGRKHIAPALSAFAKTYRDVELQLTLTDRPVNLVDQGFDLQIRFGDLPDSTLTARLLAHNRRILCAADAYLAERGEPQTPRELAQHACLFIQENDETFGTWHLRSGAASEKVKVRGPLASNDGECAVSWGLDGHGILIRSLWEVAPMLEAGTLKPVLTKWHLPAADIYAVFPTRSNLSAKTRALLEHLLEVFEPHRHSPNGNWLRPVESIGLLTPAKRGVPNESA